MKKSSQDNENARERSELSGADLGKETSYSVKAHGGKEQKTKIQINFLFKQQRVLFSKIQIKNV
jgi:hypothetical protein